MENSVKLEYIWKKTLNDENNGETKYVLYDGHGNTLGVFEDLWDMYLILIIFILNLLLFSFLIFIYDNKDNVIKNYYVKYIFEDETLLKIDYLILKRKLKKI